MRSLRFWLFLLPLLLFIASPAPAQHMYLDSNGNGVWDASDRLNPNGQPTVVDVWLDLTHNRDGSYAVCVDPLNQYALYYWNSFEVHITALGGVVTYSDYVHHVPEFTIACAGGNADFLSNNTEMAACRAGVQYPQWTGLRRLFTVTVTAVAGTPSLQIIRQGSLSPGFTMIGTPYCSGSDFDFTLKLGSDWFDADGLGPACAGCLSPPVLNPIANMTVDEGAIAMQTITATDPDGSAVQFSKAAGPTFMTVSTVDASQRIGQIALSPGYSDAGSGITGIVRASDGVMSVLGSFLITVNDVNRAPIANPGGPYNGLVGVPMAFDGSHSFDPDGTPLGFSWSFGDLSSGVGPTPTHTYAGAGAYVVLLTVTDGSLSGTANTTATITDLLAARAFTTRANRILRLGSGKPAWSIEVEPVGGSFAVGDVVASSVRLKSSGTGTVSAIAADAGKGLVQGDADGNGIADFSATFRKVDLQALFAFVTGSTSVPVTVEGQLNSGGLFRAQTDIGIVSSGGPAAAASIQPNPLNPSGELRFGLTKPGRVRAELYDAGGRMVRVLGDVPMAAAGSHSFRIDGRNRQGETLASGIYYVRLLTPDGVMTQRLAVLK